MPTPPPITTTFLRRRHNGRGLRAYGTVAPTEHRACIGDDVVKKFVAAAPTGRIGAAANVRGKRAVRSGIQGSWTSMEGRVGLPIRNLSPGGGSTAFRWLRCAADQNDIKNCTSFRVDAISVSPGAGPPQGYADGVRPAGWGAAPSRARSWCHWPLRDFRHTLRLTSIPEYILNVHNFNLLHRQLHFCLGRARRGTDSAAAGSGVEADACGACT